MDLFLDPFRGVYQPQQQQLPPRENEEHRDGEGKAIEDPHTTQEGPSSTSGGVGAVTLPTVPSDLVGTYLILWSLLSEICPY